MQLYFHDKRSPELYIGELDSWQGIVDEIVDFSTTEMYTVPYMKTEAHLEEGNITIDIGLETEYFFIKGSKDELKKIAIETATGE